MSQLPYNVNGWVSTEGLVAELAHSVKDFAPSSHEVTHLVDILGRIIPMSLAEEVVKCRKRRLEVVVVRMHVQSHLGLSDRGPVNDRVKWACTLLVGAC